MPQTSRAGVSIIDQYAKRKQKARESWAWHMLFACIPFCVFIWGPREAVIPAFVGFGGFMARGAYRQFQIDSCPACGKSRWEWYFSLLSAYARPSTSPHCGSCGVRLLVED
jgi:hypothetical protein